MISGELENGRHLGLAYFGSMLAVSILNKHTNK